jgi:F0F1-type ATP synthase epsilon subunit
MPQKLFVSINSPEQVIWEGEADAVTSENSQGPFDVLPGHVNFVTIIDKKSLLIHRLDGDREFPLEKAVIYVHGNLVTIYTNI